MKFNPFSTAAYQKNANTSEEITQPIEKEKPKVVAVSDEELSEMKNVLILAAKMRGLLEQCRYESLPMHLARKIDDVLREAERFD